MTFKTYTEYEGKNILLFVHERKEDVATIEYCVPFQKSSCAVVTVRHDYKGERIDTPYGPVWAVDAL